MQEMKFSRYEILGELGRGGMATVYRAYDPSFEREVALKILRRELLDDPQVRERFGREAKIIAKLEHAAIVPVYDVGRDNDQLFFVMRYMSGGSLSDRIQKGSLSLIEIAHITQRIGAALDYAHRKNIIHRDLKPANILFDEYGNASISDFGIAKIAHSSAKLTNTGIIGTPAYMSPEQAQGEEVDGRSDIYSLGVILFEMLSGRTPFHATMPLVMAMKHAIDPVPSILEIKPDLPKSMDEVLQKVLTKDRDQRYGTGTEFASAFIATLPEPLTPDASLDTPTPPRPHISANLMTMTPPGTERKPRFPSMLWMIGGIAILALAAFAAFSYIRSATPPIPSTPAPETVTATLESPTLTDTPSPTIAPTETVLPPTPSGPILGGTDKIALTAGNDIFIMNVDGGQIKQLTNTNTPKFDLHWLPGGHELLYGEGKCVYRINMEDVQFKSEELACFTDSNFLGFRVSPDGKQVAISIKHRLLILPFDLDVLSNAKSAFELQSLDSLCLDYSEVAVKGAQWSTDGSKLAIRYQSVIGQRLGDTIRVLEVDMQRCRDVDPLITDEFPSKRFTPDGYDKYPILPSYHWDGIEQFLFTTFKRNVSYGELYFYDIATASERRMNPVDGVCCYGNAAFSPDGTYILAVFQDVRSGADSEAQLYFIPMNQIGSGTTFTPIKLRVRFFPDPRENILLALRPVP